MIDPAICDPFGERVGAVLGSAVSPGCLGLVGQLEQLPLAVQLIQALESQLDRGAGRGLQRDRPALPVTEPGVELGQPLEQLRIVCRRHRAGAGAQPLDHAGVEPALMGALAPMGVQVLAGSHPVLARAACGGQGPIHLRCQLHGAMKLSQLSSRPLGVGAAAGDHRLQGLLPVGYAGADRLAHLVVAA